MKNPLGIQAFGRHLKRLREERQLSQEDLAMLCDISRPTVQRIETAAATPTLDLLISISEGLQMPLKDLVDFEI